MIYIDLLAHKVNFRKVLEVIILPTMCNSLGSCNCIGTANDLL